MHTSVPSVRNLLSRGRAALADAAQGREVPCHEVREAMEDPAGRGRPLGRRGSVTSGAAPSAGRCGTNGLRAACPRWCPSPLSTSRGGSVLRWSGRVPGPERATRRCSTRCRGPAGPLLARSAGIGAVAALSAGAVGLSTTLDRPAHEHAGPVPRARGNRPRTAPRTGQARRGSAAYRGAAAGRRRRPARSPPARGRPTRRGRVGSGAAARGRPAQPPGARGGDDLRAPPPRSRGRPPAGRRATRRATRPPTPPPRPSPDASAGPSAPGSRRRGVEHRRGAPRSSVRRGALGRPSRPQRGAPRTKRADGTAGE